MLNAPMPTLLVQEVTEHLLVKPLLLALADKSEACRELAIKLLIELLQVLADYLHTCLFFAMLVMLSSLVSRTVI